MNLRLLRLFIGMMLLTLAGFSAKAQQTSEEMINLLISKKVITQHEADSVRAVSALKAQDDKAKQKKFNLTSGRAIILSGYTQIRYQSLQEAGKNDGFDIRRARLDFKGAITDKWAYHMHAEFANSVKMMDATIAYKCNDYLKIMAGQTFIPFSLENLTGNTKLETIDRSQVVEALAARGKDVIGNMNGRDIGIQFSGSVLKINDHFLLDYALGIFNGAGVNTADNNEAKDFSARLIFHPIRGLDLGGSVYNGYDNWASGTPVLANNQVRNRVGGEVAYTLKALSLRGEYIYGQDGGINRSGYYAQAGYYFIPKKFQVVFKYDSYDANLSIADNISTNYTCGLNWVFNDFTRIQADYTNRHEQGAQVNNDVIAVQLQIGF